MYTKFVICNTVRYDSFRSQKVVLLLLKASLNSYTTQLHDWNDLLIQIVYWLVVYFIQLNLFACYFLLSVLHGVFSESFIILFLARLFSADKKFIHRYTIWVVIWSRCFNIDFMSFPRYWFIFDIRHCKGSVVFW